MGQDIRLGLNDPVEVGGVFSEIGNQDLHLGGRAGLANVENGPGKDLGPLIFQVVSIHRSDDGVPELERANGLSHAKRLGQIVAERSARLDGAEAASSGTDIAQDHEGGRTAFPALPDVGTVGTLTNGMKGVGADQLLEVVVALAAWETNFQPRWVSWEGSLRRFHRVNPDPIGTAA